ncbi:MAG: hypothetical protein QGH07_08360 [Alphaproteobacteria bacterium]|jgi:DNA-binding NtrC family response regulator|nr:hypothetical protein [Alphaproteobacteria bacterium]
MLRYGTMPRFKDLPVLTLTGHDTLQNLRHAHTHKIYVFLMQPPTAESLRRSVLNALKA